MGKKDCVPQEQVFLLEALQFNILMSVVVSKDIFRESLIFVVLFGGVVLQNCF